MSAPTDTPETVAVKWGHPSWDPRSTGHGHVHPRPDGMKARCGGPGICAECSREYAQLNAMIPAKISEGT